MGKVKINIYVPFHIGINMGNFNSTVKQFEQMLLKNTGGYSAYTVNGAWLNDEGKRIDDTCIVYQMYTDNHPSIIGALRGQACFIKDNLKQDTVLMTVEPVERVDFV